MQQFKLLLLLLFLPNLSLAQGIKVGVDWNIPSNPAEISSDLKLFKENGISFIQIEGVVDASIIQQIADYNFKLWVSSGLKFTRKSDKFNQDQFQDLITDPLYYYRSSPIAIDRYTLLENPQLYEGFSEKLLAVIPEVRSLFSGPIDIKSSILFDTHHFSELSYGKIMIDRQNDVTNADYIYLTSNVLRDNPAYLLRELWQQPNIQSVPFLIDSEELKHLLKTDTNFKLVLNRFSRNENSVVALPTVVFEVTNNAVITIIILICISLFVAIFTTNASYQRSIIRYMITHNFYVSDVMMKRVRISGAIPIAWFMTLTFGSVLTWITYATVFNPISLEMLKYHHPIVSSILASGTFSILLLGIISLALVQITSFFWLVLISLRKVGASQILQLFVVPQQLIVPITIIASLFYLNSSSPKIIGIFFLMFVFLVILTFLIMSIDMLKNFTGKKTSFVFFGPILYLVVWISLGYWIMSKSPIGDTIKLIIQMIN